jgi:hypothetical protein
MVNFHLSSFLRETHWVKPPASAVVTVKSLTPQLGHTTGALWLCRLWSGTLLRFCCGGWP